MKQIIKLCLLLFLLSLPTHKIQAQDAKNCWQSLDPNNSFQQCFSENELMVMHVSAIYQGNNNEYPVRGLDISYFNLYGDQAFEISKCTTSISGSCELLVPIDGMGTIISGKEGFVGDEYLWIDPKGFSDAFLVQEEFIKKMVEDGIPIEDPFNDYAYQYPYTFETHEDTEALIIVKDNPDFLVYPYHWVLFTQNGEEEPFVKNEMGNYTPSTEILPSVINKPNILSEDSSIIRDEKDVSSTDEDQFSFWFLIFLAMLIASLLFFAVRLHLLTKENE